jgi:hypothetical protein
MLNLSPFLNTGFIIEILIQFERCQSKGICYMWMCGKWELVEECSIL